MQHSGNKVQKSDQFLDAVMFVLKWIKTKKRQFLFMVALVAGVVLLWSGATLLNKIIENRANTAWTKAMNLPLNSEQQIQSLEEIGKSYGRRSAGKRAYLMLGQNFLDKDPEKAREYFEKLRAIAHEKHLLQITALYGIAKSYERQNMWKEAGDSYLKASSLPGNLLSEQTKINAALCFENAKIYASAREIYADIVKKGNADTSNFAKERLLWLDISKL